MTLIRRAHALARRAHVRIDLLVMKLPAPVRPWLHLLAMAFLLGFAATLTWAAWMLVDESLLFGARAGSAAGGTHIKKLRPERATATLIDTLPDDARNILSAIDDTFGEIAGRS